MREPVITFCAEKVIACCCELRKLPSRLRGRTSQQVCSVVLLQIIRDDINNKVRNIKGTCEQGKISLAIPFHVLHDPSLSTTRTWASSNAKIIIVLASQAVKALDRTRNQASGSFQLSRPSTPARCSARFVAEKEISAPFHRQLWKNWRIKWSKLAHQKDTAQRHDWLVAMPLNYGPLNYISKTLVSLN